MAVNVVSSAVSQQRLKQDTPQRGNRPGLLTSLLQLDERGPHRVDQAGWWPADCRELKPGVSAQSAGQPAI
ncbi:MAG: hypothetical protein M3460_27220 [Actinomycetota bacterium]|nr:hypothetical protein [Actinomycetota bacterium]